MGGGFHSKVDDIDKLDGIPTKIREEIKELRGYYEIFFVTDIPAPPVTDRERIARRKLDMMEARIQELRQVYPEAINGWFEQ